MTMESSPVRKGIHRGLTVGAISMAYVVVIAVASGGEVLRRNHTSLLTLLVVYGLGGAAAGAIAGALHRVGWSLPGAMLVGVLTTFPGACLVWASLALQSDEMVLNWEALEVIGFLALLSTVIAGPFYGAVAWYNLRRRTAD